MCLVTKTCAVCYVPQEMNYEEIALKLPQILILRGFVRYRLYAIKSKFLYVTHDTSFTKKLIDLIFTLYKFR